MFFNLHISLFFSLVLVIMLILCLRIYFLIPLEICLCNFMYGFWCPLIYCWFQKYAWLFFLYVYVYLSSHVNTSIWEFIQDLFRTFRPWIICFLCMWFCEVILIFGVFIWASGPFPMFFFLKKVFIVFNLHCSRKFKNISYLLFLSLIPKL